MKNLLRLYLGLFILLLTNCENEPLDIYKLSQSEVIEVSSEAYAELNKMIEDETDQSEILCAKFIFPVTIFVFDENIEFAFPQTVNSNTEFSLFLGSLEDTQSISLSFPISTTQSDGTNFIIENIEDLKISIDNCRKKSVIRSFENLVRQCVWEISEIEDQEQLFAGGFFIGLTGIMNFIFEEEVNLGTWNFLFIGNELHLNMFFIEETEISEYFNFDWIVTDFSDTHLVLTRDQEIVRLNKRCLNEENDDCIDLNFTQCETEVNTGISGFIFNNLVECILQIENIEFSINTLEISFHENLIEANENNNAIPADEPYFNFVNNQIIVMRISNFETNTITFIEFTISAATC